MNILTQLNDIQPSRHISTRVISDDKSLELGSTYKANKQTTAQENKHKEIVEDDKIDMRTIL